MKRLHKYFLIFLIVGQLKSYASVTIYVSVSGSDLNTGSASKPMATVAAALKMAREMRRLNNPTLNGGIHILLMGGTYVFYEPLYIRPEDSGTKESPLFIESAPGEHAILSGGIKIFNWAQLKENSTGIQKMAWGKIWIANVPPAFGNDINFRQLWVNQNKAVRAKDANGDKMNRILGWDKSNGTCIIPTPKFNGMQGVIGMELFIHQWWAIANLRVRQMEVSGDSTKLFFHQPESKIQNEHPWPAPWISKETGNSAFYLTNAIQFLDEPGEWFLDRQQHKIYYWPKANENMLTAEVIAPNLETLVKIEGSVDHPVYNIFFKEISFEYTGWLRPSLMGHVPHQAGMYMTEAYKLRPAGTAEKPGLDNQAWVGRPAAAVEINNAKQTTFQNCRFQHLASTGLDYNSGVKNGAIYGNLFKDIGGTALLGGVYSDPSTEIHLPYNPKDEREVCDSLIISNNLISNATNEDWSCVGLGIGYSRNTTIEHNEIEDVSYTGISMGWGWSTAPNAMKNNKIIGNKIHHFGKHNYDCAGIYTLSAQPNSHIADNYIDSIYKAPYAHLPSHWFYLYGDEGSSYFTVKNNWTPSKKYLQNANGPGNKWTNNGPQVDAAIKQKAGIETAYNFLLYEKSTLLNAQPTNEEHYEVIELVVKEGKQLDLPKLKLLLFQNKMDSTAIYQWQNHYIVFDKVVDIGVMQGRLQNNFPEAEVKIFHDMFYEYSRKKHCNDTTTAREWQHIILTANLVANPKLQQEYLNYHAKQFEQWPEVSKGFCNASFQQLLIFKNERQLMLVISIPKGENLDKLNPKTTENNPKMIEWNKRMGKYQEGIQGTKKGETWVFLKPLK